MFSWRHTNFVAPYLIFIHVVIDIDGLYEDDIPAKIVIPCRQNEKVFKGVS